MKTQKTGEPLPFEACENFRELGGYPGCGGKTVRRGVFYRAPALANIHTPADVQRFCALGIRKAFDFRSALERADAPDPVFEGVENIAVSALIDENGTEIDFDLEEMLRTREGMQRMVQQVHEGYARIPFGNKAYRRMFDAIRADEVPILFHCTAGKDRTGVAAALILKMLGVSDADIMADYLRTNECRRTGVQQVCRMIEAAGHPHELAMQLAKLASGVRAESLQSALDAIAQRYDSYERYLEAEYGIEKTELEQIRERYLE